MILYSSGRLKDMKRKHLKNNQIERHYDGYLTKNKWDNTHSDFMSMDTNKMYTYYSDIYIETPFFETIQRRYDAVEYKYQVFGKTATKGRCPCCGDQGVNNLTRTWRWRRGMSFHRGDAHQASHFAMLRKEAKKPDGPPALRALSAAA